MEIVEKIKTFDDAVNFLGESNVFVSTYNNIRYLSNISKHILSYTKLCIVCIALNKEWQDCLEYIESEQSWRPYLYLVGNLKYFVGARLDPDLCDALYSSPYLSFKSESLAKYCGNQFIDLWISYYDAVC